MKILGIYKTYNGIIAIRERGELIEQQPTIWSWDFSKCPPDKATSIFNLAKLSDIQTSSAMIYYYETDDDYNFIRFIDPQSRDL
ncbi:MAG: hypothetical protein KGI54_14850 [Pseudomonadota bacterium]|nr:hypothetical protein [Pseudomonadota bacterium]